MDARFGGQPKDHHIADSLPPTGSESLRNARGPKKSLELRPRISGLNPSREARVGVPSRRERRKVERRLGEERDVDPIAPLRNLQAPIDNPERLEPVEEGPGAFLRHGEHERPFPR
jgi:hypothetical protein